MKDLTKRVVIGLGLERPARRVWSQLKSKAREPWGLLHARGWTPWKPLVPQDRFTACVRHAVSRLRELEPANEFGDYLEFGVSRGTSLACVDRVLQQMDLGRVRLIGFDSFKGMPAGSDQEGWPEGAYRSTLAATRRYLKTQSVNLERVVLVRGWFKDTLTPRTRAELKLGKASLIMIDCDIYSASKKALAFCERHIKEQAVIMFDDWGSAIDLGNVGQKEVFDEFMAAHPEFQAERLPAYNDASRVFLVRRLGAESGDDRHL